MASAESIYAFRHALMREAMYQLQPPAERAPLHQAALELLAPFDTPGAGDGLALELADHAHGAWQGLPPGPMRVQMQQREAQWLLRAARHARGHHDPHRALAIFDRLLQCESAEPTVRLEAMLGASETASFLGQAKAAIELATDVLGLALQAKDHATAGRALLAKVNARLVRADPTQQVEDDLDAAQGHFHAASEAAGAARVLGYRANLAIRDCRHEDALRLLSDALAAFRGIGHARGTSTTLGNLAVVLRRTGDTGGAEAMLQQAMEADASAGNAEGEARHIGNLAMVRADQGRLDEAIALFERADDLFMRLGDGLAQSRNCISYGQALARQGHSQRALAEYARAQRIGEELGLHTRAGFALWCRGELLLEMGDLVRGESVLAEAVTVLVQGQAWHDAAECQWRLALAAESRKDLPAAEKFSRGAIKHLRKAKELGTPLGYDVLRGHAEFARKLNDHATAAKSATEALKQAAKLGISDDVQLRRLRQIAGQSTSRV